MAEGQLAYYGGAEPFKSDVYSVSDGAPGLQAFNLGLNHHDMVIVVFGKGGDRTQVLHLQNIREDTLSEAGTAIKQFLDNFGSLGDGVFVQNTVFQDYGSVYDELDRIVLDIDFGVDNVEKDLINIENDSSNYPKIVNGTTAGKYNPVCELFDACNEFRDRLGSIMEKASGQAYPEKFGEIWITGSYPPHQCLLTYLEEQSEGRDLKFYWETHGNNSSSGQRTFYDDLEWVQCLKEEVE
ncbi:unnamed protein product [Clonostachys byssicola]|uniref:Uncharacterized protein n=1 Tax=Clonostachys byssicola TaxID=160290 RepID=A0A9N9XW26_9HYPO|nr:unnamed protein product [Clonostachys byssicola]